MHTQVEQFTEQFEAINGEIMVLVSGYSDAQWRRTCASEGWLLGVVAHHVAVMYRDFLGLLTSLKEALAAGQMLPPRPSIEVVYQTNALHARDFASVGKAETLDALRANGTALAHLLRTFGDEQLDRAAKSLAGRT